MNASDLSQTYIDRLLAQAGLMGGDTDGQAETD
jgi:hypothetical protein